MLLLGKIMILQGVGHPISCLGVCYANDPKKGGYMTPAPALDLTTSLRGDFSIRKYEHNNFTNTFNWGNRPFDNSRLPTTIATLHKHSNTHAVLFFAISSLCRYKIRHAWVASGFFCPPSPVRPMKKRLHHLWMNAINTATERSTVLATYSRGCSCDHKKGIRVCC